MTVSERLLRKRASNLKWQRANREKVAEHQRRYRAKPSTKAKEASHRLAWRKANPERDRENRHRWRNANPQKLKLIARKVNLKSKFGLTFEAFNAMLASQGDRCAICASDSPGWVGDWHVDHCHETNKVRGVLCTHCNRMLHGRVTPKILRDAALYLERSEQ